MKEKCLQNLSEWGTMVPTKKQEDDIMDPKKIMRIFADTAYVRMGGSEEELRAAEYLKQCCADMGLEAAIEGFPVPMAKMEEAILLADGQQILVHPVAHVAVDHNDLALAMGQAVGIGGTQIIEGGLHFAAAGA